ncbi:DUF1465 family protein [Qipengyuania sp. 483]|nr:AraC family transcriptional regulator [Erythrobacter sp.]|tara:strand:+ start:268 stop:726 length:459 start_codon:yes stop_codon:yes gene_type:complete
MVGETAIREQVVDELYAHALELADEARVVFDLRDEALLTQSSDRVRIAMSIEGLRTTTRVMHVLAWLLNQRAYHAGELSKLQVLRDGTLGEDRPSDPNNLVLLQYGTQSLIQATERLHERVRRLDDEQRQLGERHSAVQEMQGRIAQAFGTA